MVTFSGALYTWYLKSRYCTAVGGTLRQDCGDLEWAGVPCHVIFSAGIRTLRKRKAEAISTAESIKNRQVQHVEFYKQ